MEPDGFFKFNARATQNLAAILAETNAALVLTTSHRINHSLAAWAAFFNARGLFPSAITKINARTTRSPGGSRAREIAAWVATQDTSTNYVVLDDDLSLHGLPPPIKSRCVITKPLLGLDAEATQQALHILRSNPTALSL